MVALGGAVTMVTVLIGHTTQRAGTTAHVIMAGVTHSATKMAAVGIHSNVRTAANVAHSDARMVPAVIHGRGIVTALAGQKGTSVTITTHISGLGIMPTAGHVGDHSDVLTVAAGSGDGLPIATIPKGAGSVAGTHKAHRTMGVEQNDGAGISLEGTATMEGRTIRIPLRIVGRAGISPGPGNADGAMRNETLMTTTALGHVVLAAGLTRRIKTTTTTPMAGNPTPTQRTGNDAVGITDQGGADRPTQVSPLMETVIRVITNSVQEIGGNSLENVGLAMVQSRHMPLGCQAV